LGNRSTQRMRQAKHTTNFSKLFIGEQNAATEAHNELDIGDTNFSKRKKPPSDLGRPMSCANCNMMCPYVYEMMVLTQQANDGVILQTENVTNTMYERSRHKFYTSCPCYNLVKNPMSSLAPTTVKPNKGGVQTTRLHSSSKATTSSIYRQQVCNL
jgi:hypothetical protein